MFALYRWKLINPGKKYLLQKAVGFCIQREKKSSIDHWVSENNLFQKYPRLLLLEQGQCKKALNQFNQIFSYIIISGLHRNPFIMSRVLSSCCFDDVNLRRDYATLIFNQIGTPNTFSWNTMIRVASPTYYIHMLRCGALPDKYTFPLLLQACGSVSDLDFAKQVHSHAVMFGFETDLYVQNSLLHVYCVVSESVLDSYQLFDGMNERDVVSWTTMISGLVVQGHYAESLLVFTRMKVVDVESSVWPNVATIVSVMSACANLGSLDYTRGLHAYFEKMGWLHMEVSISNSLIDAYAKCGSIGSAIQIFHEIASSRRDTYSWTAVISGLAMHGCGREAIKWFSQMKQVVGHGVFPDAVTFIAVLSACAHAGLVDEGMKIFESMELGFGIVPEVQHYGCMVDLFGRAGFLEYAYRFLERMPMEPNLAILGSLLSACRLHNNMELGEAVSKKIYSSCEYGGGAPVLIANMYANENRYCEVVDVRKMMREGENNMKKPPGRSWIEVQGMVHEFVVGDKSHPQFMELYKVLYGLRRLLSLC